MKGTQFISLMIKLALAVALTTVSATMLMAQDGPAKAKQREFCGSNSYTFGKRSSASELRELNLPAAGPLNVDGGRNGGIKVRGENRSDVAVRACVQVSAASEDAARSLLSSVKLSSAGSTLSSDGPDGVSYSVSYDIRVPSATDLSLTAHNGGIAISGVEGRIEFTTTNGGVALSDVAGEVKGRTTNGGVNVALGGSTWSGRGLDVQTTNGGVRLSMPETYSANIETGTVNGGFKSDIAAVKVSQEDVKGADWSTRARRINTVMNGGGPTIRVITTNGGIYIGRSDARE